MAAEVQVDLRIETEPFAQPGIVVIDPITEKDMIVKPYVPDGTETKTGTERSQIEHPGIVIFFCLISRKMGMRLHGTLVTKEQLSVPPQGVLISVLVVVKLAIDAKSGPPASGFVVERVIDTPFHVPKIHHGNESQVCAEA